MQNELKSVDFSGQGLTVVPTTLFKRRDIGYLNLSSNNIRSLPLDIHLLGMLRRLDLSANGLRCSSPNDNNTLPREMEKLIFLEELILAECNLMYCPATVWQLTSLKFLDLSRNRLGKLPSEIGNLFNLRHLNVQQAGLRTLPPEIVCCEQLEVLQLFGNPIDSLPDTMRELVNLHTMTLNPRAFCTVIDDHMETLLQKGQIHSEHIAPVLFDIPKLQTLELEHCKINHLPDNISQGVRYLSIAENFFTSLPISVCKIAHLDTLDITNNSISTLPSAFKQLVHLRRLFASYNHLDSFCPEFLALKSLEVLNLSHNKISELPEKINSLSHLKTLILDENLLTTIPDSLCEITSLRTLDLTGNKLTSIPTRMYQLTNIRTAHTFEGLFRVGFWIHRNPLTVPPPNIWKTKDPMKIWNYLRSVEIRGIENLQTLKVVTLGEDGSGKSSLLKALITGRPQEEVQPTSAYDLISWTTTDTVKFLFIDMGTNPVYHSLLPKLMDTRALLVITVDIEAVMRNGFDREVGPWLERVAFFAPGAAVMLVGTKLDAYIASLNASDNEADPEEEAEIQGGNGVEQPFSEKDKPQILLDDRNTDELMPNNISDPIDLVVHENYQEPEEIDEDEEELAKRLGEMLWRDANTFIANMKVSSQSSLPKLCGANEQILITAARSEGLYGVHEFGTALETAAINSSIFPHNQRYVPNTWRSINSMIKRMDGPFLLRNDVEEAIQQEYGLRGQAVADCIQYLHDTGEILYFAKLPILKEYVFHRPRRLQRLLSCICRADLDSFLDYEDRIFKCRGHLSEEQFALARESALSYGELSKPIVDCMLFQMQTAGLAHGETIETLTQTAELFGLGYSIPLPEIPEGKIYNQPVLVLPQCNQVDAPSDFLSTLESQPDPTDENQWQRSAVARFPRRIPIGLWEFLVTQLHTHVDYRVDWKQMVYARQDEVHLILTRTDADEDSSPTVTAVAWCAQSPEVDFIAWVLDTLHAVHTIWPNIPMTITSH